MKEQDIKETRQTKKQTLEEAFDFGVQQGERARASSISMRGSLMFLVIGFFIFLFNPIIGGVMLALGLFGIIIAFISMFSDSPVIQLLKSFEAAGSALVYILLIFLYAEFSQEVLTSFSIVNPIILIALTMLSLYSTYSYFRDYRELKSKSISSN